MTDRYARLNHGYDDVRTCSEYNHDSDNENNNYYRNDDDDSGNHLPPQECLDGMADAQTAVALENLVSNILTVFSSPVVGSVSDQYGRKGIF